jgi:hypothetical protein
VGVAEELESEDLDMAPTEETSVEVCPLDAI